MKNKARCFYPLLFCFIQRNVKSERLLLLPWLLSYHIVMSHCLHFTYGSISSKWIQHWIEWIEWYSSSLYRVFISIWRIFCLWCSDTASFVLFCWCHWCECLSTYYCVAGATFCSVLFGVTFVFDPHRPRCAQTKPLLSQQIYGVMIIALMLLVCTRRRHIYHSYTIWTSTPQCSKFYHRV